VPDDKRTIINCLRRDFKFIKPEIRSSHFDERKD
jgi:hypothetical protein